MVLGEDGTVAQEEMPHSMAVVVVVVDLDSHKEGLDTRAWLLSDTD